MRLLRQTLPIGLVLLVALLYAPVREFEFVALDDPDYVSDNPMVSGGLTAEGLRWAFGAFHSDNWHPLTWISHMLDCELFGLDAGPHHLVNVGFHAANTILLLVALQLLTRRFWPSLIVAALFALHPLHVESVAWVAERKDLLAGFFWMLTLIAYAFHARRPRLGSYLLLLACFTAGLLAKPMVVTLPFVLLLLDLWPLGRLKAGSLRALLLEKAPLLLLAALSSLVTLRAQSAEGAVQALDAVPFGERIVNTSLAYVAYPWKSVWPMKLACFYPHPATIGEEADLARIGGAAVAALLLLALSALAWRCREKQPWLATGWLWYLGTLVPVIGIVQVGGQSIADRYTYLPMIGIYLALTWSIRDLLERRPRLLAPAVALLLVSLGFFSIRTRSQVETWRDSFTLYSHAVRTTENNYFAHINLGAEMMRRGRVAEAESHFRRTIEIRPDFSAAHYNLGMIAKRRGDLEQAAASLELALDGYPDDADAHLNLGVIRDQQGSLRAARAHYEEAIRIRPGFALAHLNLGNLLARSGNPERALFHFEEALRLDPRNETARRNRDAVLRMTGGSD